MLDETQTETVDETSPEEEGTSEKTTTFTQEDLDKAVAKAKSDALAAAGRDFKGLSDAKKAVDAATLAAQSILDKAAKVQQEQDERDLANAEGDPDKITILRERIAVRKERLALEEEKAKRAEEDARNEAELNEARQRTRQSEIEKIVEEKKIDQTKLAELIDDTMSIESIRKIASVMTPIATNTPRSDGGETAGGVAQTEMEIKKDFIDGKITAEERSKKLRAIGVNPNPNY